MERCMECDVELKEHELPMGLCAKCNKSINGMRSGGGFD